MDVVKAVQRFFGRVWRVICTVKQSQPRPLGSSSLNDVIVSCDCPVRIRDESGEKPFSVSAC